MASPSKTAQFSLLRIEYSIFFHRIPDGKAPRFPKKPTIRQEGDVLVMECLLEANPAPDISWFQGTKAISDNNRIRMIRKATGKDVYMLTLEISNPTREDGGNYRCNAFNSYGESNANISLNFQGMRRTILCRLCCTVYILPSPFRLLRHLVRPP